MCLLVFSFHHSPLNIGAMCIVEKWRPNKYLSCLPSRCSTLRSLHVAQTIFCFPLQNWIKKDLLSRLLFRPFFRISRIRNLCTQYTVMQCRYVDVKDIAILVKILTKLKTLLNVAYHNSRSCLSKVNCTIFRSAMWNFNKVVHRIFEYLEIPTLTAPPSPPALPSPACAALPWAGIVHC